MIGKILATEQVEFSENGFVVDARVIASAFDLEPARIQEFMRSGEITSRCERGVDEDEGKWRLTFWHENRAFRLTVDDSGAVLSRAGFPVQRKPGAR